MYNSNGEKNEIVISELANIINKTSFAMAYQDARHFLNGLHLCSESGKLIAVCTDGHRLAKYASEIAYENELSIIDKHLFRG